MASPRLGVVIAILEADRVVLTQREDFEVWCMPGGAVEAGESLAEAARREAHEETGLEVELTRLVGLYSRPLWRDRGGHMVLFAARPMGGALARQTDETINAGFFGLDDLPSPLIWGHRRLVLDALAQRAETVIWTQNLAWLGEGGGDLPREKIYTERDHSGLSRLEFYNQRLIPFVYEEDVLEIGETQLHL